MYGLGIHGRPVLPSAVSGFELRVEIAAIHPACVCDSKSRALMESAGRFLITLADSRSPVPTSGSADPGLTCNAITFIYACAIVLDVMLVKFF